MKNDSDRITYKIKNFGRKKKKENNSNSSRESLEMELESYRKNNKLCRRKTQAGEEIKFFFNEPSEKKNQKINKSSISSCKTNPISRLNLPKQKNEFNFKDILLHYVNSPKCPTKKKEDDKLERRTSIIYGDPETVLTLNGDENSEDSSNKSKKSSDSNSSNSGSESDSKSKSSSNSKGINSDKKSNTKNNKKEKKNKLDFSKEESSYKINTSKYDDSAKIFSHSNNTNNSNNDEEEEVKGDNNREIFKNDDNKSNGNNQIISNNLKNSEKLECNIKKSKDSCFNSLKNSQKLKNSNANTFTTATNTQNTHKTQNTNNSSFQSLKINNKKIKYNYLCWKDLPLQKKLIIKNRSNSVKKIDVKKENKDNLIKDENTAIMIYKLKHLNISLDIEKSYCYYFKNLTNLLSKKNITQNKSYNNINISNNQKNKLKDNQEKSFYYPNEYYINKKNTLHNKLHISNLFDKIRQYKNNC